MSVRLHTIADAYVRATNEHDAAAFLALFAEDAVVHDAGREIRGRNAIKAWSQSDIFDAQVSLEVLGVAERDGETIVTTKVDGNFDRTGLPDPVVIDHHIRVDRDRIVALSCRLASEPQRATAARAEDDR